MDPRNLPDLVCQIGQKLKVKDDITFEGGLVIKKNETCIVENIKGYGFDIVTDKDKEYLRIMNSQMLKYFQLI